LNENPSSGVLNPRLGIPEMDSQHDYLYSLFARLVVPQTREELKALLGEIEGMLDFHFTSEEQLMRHYRVPGFAAHQTDHEQAAQAFLDGVEDFERDRLNPARLRGSLAGWLAEHSRSVDMEYAVLIRDLRLQAGWVAAG
jgi:hemerythrin-like metal-binding protein